LPLSEARERSKKSTCNNRPTFLLRDRREIFSAGKQFGRVFQPAAMLEFLAPILPQKPGSFRVVAVHCPPLVQIFATKLGLGERQQHVWREGLRLGLRAREIGVLLWRGHGKDSPGKFADNLADAMRMSQLLAPVMEQDCLDIGMLRPGSKILVQPETGRLD
jgi:hypothetical protein